jgi:hypothetical protein
MHTTLNRCTFPLADVSGFKQKVLNWLKPFGIFCYLDNQQYAIAPQEAECLVAAGVRTFIEGNDIKDADVFLTEHPWAFGHLSYELKTGLRPLPPIKNDDTIVFTC